MYASVIRPLYQLRGMAVSVLERAISGPARACGVAPRRGPVHAHHGPSGRATVAVRVNEAMWTADSNVDSGSGADTDRVRTECGQNVDRAGGQCADIVQTREMARTECGQS